jgi:hypothetical protein
MRKFKEPIWIDNCRIGGTPEKTERVPHKIVCTEPPLTCEIFEHVLHSKFGYVFRIKINGEHVWEGWCFTLDGAKRNVEAYMRGFF